MRKRPGSLRAKASVGSESYGGGHVVVRFEDESSVDPHSLARLALHEQPSRCRGATVALPRPQGPMSLLRDRVAPFHGGPLPTRRPLPSMFLRRTPPGPSRVLRQLAYGRTAAATASLRAR